MKKSISLISSFFLIISICCNPEGYQTGRESQHNFNGPCSGDYLNHIAFPIGGIGAGMICLEGTGAISHVSVFNKPDVFNEPTMFTAISVKGMENGAKVLEGPVPERKIFGRPSTARGAPRTTYGLPRFKYSEFVAHIPFGTIRLQDDDIPLEVSLTAWSPFIPQDADNSSLPCGAIEYTFKNPTNFDIEAVFSYNTVNFISQPGDRNTIKPYPNGFILSNLAEDENQHMQGDFAIFTTEKNNLIDHCWFRGAWFDPLSISWKHIAEANPRVTDPVDENAPGASLYIPFVLKPHETKTIKLLMSWYVPNTYLRKGQPIQGDPAGEWCENPYHRPWYSSRFYNINEVADYWLINYNELRSSSELFTEAFYNTTLPDAVVEAVAANLTILKSPTVLRQYDGRLWAFEGCNDESGCYAGSCTHVWNYAQAIPHLFSSLERSLRETEFLVSQNEEGHQTFRSALPIRKVGHRHHAAADGQLGGIIKVFRDWRISGDNEWLEKIDPFVKTSLDYCIRAWDPSERGILEEPHHNTYDVEFWGPNGMSTSFYLGALKAFIIMGEFLGDNVQFYQSLLDMKNISFPQVDKNYFPGGGNSVQFLSPGGIYGLAGRLAYSTLNGMFSMVWDEASTIDLPEALEVIDSKPRKNSQ